MKKITMLVLGVIMAAATVGGVYATSDVSVPASNANCKMSIESKKETLKQYVTNGTITQEKSDEILKQLENCDGTGNAKIGQNNGISFGAGKAKGQGASQGNGMKNMNGANCTAQK